MKTKHLFAAAVAACTMPTWAHAVVEYACTDQGGAEVYATLFDEEDVVVVRYVSFNTGQAVEERFNPAVSGSGFRYVSQNGSEFIGQGDTAILLSPGSPQVDCVVSRVIAPGDGQAGGYDPQVGPFSGISLGGNLRDGPGLNFGAVGATNPGQPITLLTDSGIFFDGFSWWVVVLSNGQQAYQWGGLLCASGLQLAGVNNTAC
jgi:hypothetical protein